MSHFSMFVPIKPGVESANVSMGHDQVIGIILCFFPKWYIIYPVLPVYYCPGNPSNTISLGYLKCFVGFQKVTSEPLEHCDFFNPQGCYWRTTYQTRKNLDYIQIKISKVNPQINKYIVVPTVCGLKKHNLSYLIHNIFGCILITRLVSIAIKVLMKSLPENIPDL